MKFGKKILTVAFVFFVFAAGLVIDTSAQSKRRVVRRPVIVRHYIYRDPFWYSRYYDSWYWRSPYVREMERRYQLQRELAGNERELAKHLREYRADGVITAKERRELDDDYKDVRESRARLRMYLRY